MKNIHIVIMAGGIGSRFWPISTPKYPKQFIDILNCGKSLIQLTVNRFINICPIDNFWIVTNECYLDLVKEQLPNIPQNHILAEPIGRNTAPCIAWACWNIHKEDPNANVIVTPSDSLIIDQYSFNKIIIKALDFTANHDSIITLGIKPNRPETGYGYIQICDVHTQGICQVNKFKEKPDFETAKKYLSNGHFLWNSGIFIWNINTIITSIRKYKPDIANIMDLIMERGITVDIFSKCEKVSIDIAVMEPAAEEGKVYTYPADIGWSDLGNWTSLHEQLTKDPQNNSIIGNSINLYECSNCIIYTKKIKKAIIQGLDGYIVSEKDGSLLICKKSEEQKIKDYVSIK